MVSIKWTVLGLEDGLENLSLVQYIDKVIYI